MRALDVLLAATLVLAGLPLAVGQDAPPVLVGPLLEDAAGDVALRVDATPVGNPGGRYQAADLIGLAIEESQEAFTFRLTVASLAPDPDTPVESSQYSVDMAHNGARYRLHVFRSVIQAVDYFAVLEGYDAARDEFDSLTDLPITADAGTNTMSVAVPRDLLIDGDGAEPFPGRTLGGFRVESRALFEFGDGSISLGPGGQVPIPQSHVGDAMPDSGNGTIDWPVRLGLQQTGNAHLSSQVPTRASNGEATTFVFVVEARNAGPTQRFRLGTQGVPANWAVDLPSDLIEIEGDQTVLLPVLVTTPFAHQHGSLQDFVLEMAGTEHSDDVGRVRLGVRYTAPPQPAGHHDLLFLHTAKLQGDQTLQSAFGTAFGSRQDRMYFNTLSPDEDENDARTPMAGDLSGTEVVPPAMTYRWDLPLSPALQMGLDFDLNRTGTIKVAFDTLLPLPGAVLTGRIVHTAPDGGSFDDCQRGCDFTEDDFLFGFGNHTTAARLGPSAPQDVAANSKGTLFEVPIVPTKEGDYFPFRPGASLSLQLNLTFTRVDPFFGPHDAPLLEGGEMTLPLLEYHDPVDQVFSSLSGLMIQVQGEQQRLVNPGKTALFHLLLINHGNKSAEYDLELTGTNLPWARILGDLHVGVDAGKSRDLGIAVTVPTEASDGDVADLVLAAVDAKDPSVRTLARVVVTVDSKAEHPDDSAQVPGLEQQLKEKKSPAPSALLLAAGLAAAALVLRRRKA